MRGYRAVAWLLVLVVVALPAFRHASAPAFGGSSHASFEHQSRSTPHVARTAPSAGVTTGVPVFVPVATLPLLRPPKISSAHTAPSFVPPRL